MRQFSEMSERERLATDALTDAAQFIDAVAVDAKKEGWWSEWDQQMREKITKALCGLYAP